MELTRKMSQAGLTQISPGSTPPLTFELIAGGRSNLTYKVWDANNEGYVLRRPPLGHVLESAHDMGREHKIISSLGPTDIPVAPALGLCKDKSVNGADFYVMKLVEGDVITDSVGAKAHIDENKRHDLGMEVIDILVRLHAVNPDDVGLGDLGKKRGLRGPAGEGDGPNSGKIPRRKMSGRWTRWADC